MAPPAWSESRKVGRARNTRQLGIETSAGAPTIEDWKRSGFRRPGIFQDAERLGLIVPRRTLTVAEVAKIVGKSHEIPVIKVRTQSTYAAPWTLERWAAYFERADRRRETLNVISLEFSKTDLASQVRSPEVVRAADWIDCAWPLPKGGSALYPCPAKPQTQYYCLMSVGGCYTDFHVDFGGTAVWYHVLWGEKVFFLIEPSARNLRLYEAWSNSATQHATFFADEVDACARVELHAGETLLIPSAWIHAVYTPEDSMTFGGNFIHGYDLENHLRVHDLEARTGIMAQFRFPNFEPLMLFGAAKAYRRLATNAPNGDLSAFESDGLHALLDRAAGWLRDGTLDAPTAATAAAMAHLPSAEALLTSLRALLQDKPKLTIKLPRKKQHATIIRLPNRHVDGHQPPPDQESQNHQPPRTQHDGAPKHEAPSSFNDDDDDDADQTISMGGTDDDHHHGLTRAVEAAPLGFSAPATSPGCPPAQRLGVAPPTGARPRPLESGAPRHRAAVAALVPRAPLESGAPRHRAALAALAKKPKPNAKLKAKIDRLLKVKRR